VTNKELENSRKMSGPSLDLEKPNVIGGLDRLVTNFAMSAIAVVPTFFVCIAKPWRLSPLLDKDDPDGRTGMLLAPGAFFPLALMVSFIIAALLATPETINTNGSYIGPDLAVAVQSAASKGDVWKIIATIMPIYGMTVFIGLLAMTLKPWVGQHWTLRVSLRAGFYIIGVLTSWMILVTAVGDLIQLSTGSYKTASLIYKIVIVPTLGSVFWMYFWFFNNNGSVSKLRSGALSLAMAGLVFAVFAGLNFLIIFLSRL